MRRLLRSLVVLLLVAPAVSVAPAWASPPSNDFFAAASALTVGQTVNGTTAEATGEAGEPFVEGEATGPGCTGTAGACQRSLWYSLTPTVSGPITVSACGAAVEVFTGPSLSTLGAVAAIRPTNCPASLSQGFDAYAGLTYRIGVAGPDGNGQLFTLSTSATPETGGGLAAYTVYSQSPFVFTPTSPNAGASFQCSVDQGAFSACAVPVSLALPDGRHDVRVRAFVAGVPDPTPLEDNDVEIDDVGPTATFTNQVPPDGGQTNGVPTFTVHSNETSGSGLLCALDEEPLGICGLSDYPSTFGGLCNGNHRVRFETEDGAYNRSATIGSTWTTSGQSTGCQAPVVNSVAATGGYTSAEVNARVSLFGEGSNVRVTLSGPGGTTVDVSAVGHTAGSSTGQAAWNFDGLQPNTTYGYSVSVTNFKGAGSASGSLTTTGPPGSASATVSNVTDHEATLSGSYDPNGEGGWAFLLGTTPAYGTLLPIGFAFPESNGPASFSHRVGGLPSGTAIHWTLTTARNDSVSGYNLQTADATFTTAGAAQTGGPGGGGPGGGPGGAPTAAARVSRAGAVVVHVRGSHVVVGTGVKVTCAHAATCTVTVTAALPKIVRGKTHGQQKAFSRVRLKVAPGRSIVVSVTLSAPVVRALRKSGRLTLLLSVAVSASGGAPVTKSLSVPVRRPARFL